MGTLSPRVIAVLAIAVGNAPFGSSAAGAKAVDGLVGHADRTAIEGGADRATIENAPTADQRKEWRLFAQPTPVAPPPPP